MMNDSVAFTVLSLAYLAVCIAYPSDSSTSNRNRTCRRDHGRGTVYPPLDTWIWTDAAPAKPVPIIDTSDVFRQSIPDAPSDPCDSFKPPVPNYSAPGRRKSEAKCYEHIWHIKYRMDMEKRDKECEDKRKREGGSHILVIGGRRTTPGEFPHMGAIGWRAADNTSWIFKCGGSLISSKFVLTAAHCASTTSRDTEVSDVVPKIVRLGDQNIADTSDSDSPVDGTIIKITVHPEYRSPKKYSDIALVELEFDVEFTKFVQPACLWINPDDKSLMPKATVTGWGVVETAGRKTSPDLQAAVLDIIDRKTCGDLLGPSCNRLWCGLQDTQICAGKLEGGVDSCQGDSGGPLQVGIQLPTSSQGAMHYVVGVTSFGIGCALENMPGVYTKVARYLDWIEGIVWP